MQLSFIDSSASQGSPATASFILDPLEQLGQSLFQESILNLFPKQYETPDFHPEDILYALDRLQQRATVSGSSGIQRKLTADLTQDDVAQIVWRQDSTLEHEAVTFYKLADQAEQMQQRADFQREITELRAFFALATQHSYTLVNDVYRPDQTEQAQEEV